LKHKTHIEIFGQFFKDLHLSGIYPDGKLISDAIPKLEPELILENYEVSSKQEDFDLKTFFEDHFYFQEAKGHSFKSDSRKSADEHIRSLWSVLKRSKDELVVGSSLVPLPFSYIVPGGRFNEIYYWDSYFTMLGLKIHGEHQVIEAMIKNFSWLIDNVGFIPNGNRTYFLGRSQPPFFSLMLELFDELYAETNLGPFQNTLTKEYQFWMEESVETDFGNEQDKVIGHLVKMEKGRLNRYFDKFPQPREEMYKDDIELHQNSSRNSVDLFKHIRSACESGWDFSSRWFEDFANLDSIQTADILPVDLNCLLYNLELVLAKAAFINKNKTLQQEYLDKATARKACIQHYFWNEKMSYFTDYNFKTKSQLDHINMAGLFPLFFGLATIEQAEKVHELIVKSFLMPGGVRTTTINSGQQWDAPNGWAPLQWIAVKGLLRYGFKDTAYEIAKRWVALNEKVYDQSGKFVEKYNVENINLEAGGGEYPVQDGFGWSNGVYLALKELLNSSS